jgi:hypothetical protein
LILGAFQQLRQLGHVEGYPPRLIANRPFSPLTFLSLAVSPFSDGDLWSGAGARERHHVSISRHSVGFALTLAGALTAAWDGLLGYGLFKLMSTVF